MMPGSRPHLGVARASVASAPTWSKARTCLPGWLLVSTGSVLVNVTVVASVVASLAAVPKTIQGRIRERPATRTVRGVGPEMALVGVVVLIYLNQVLFTVYVV